MQAHLHVRKDDKVMVITGEDKGKTGRVLKSDPKKRRVIVEGINYIKRHMRRSQQHPRGGIVEKEAPIDASNVLLVCPNCGKTTRTMTTRIGEHDRGRVCKKCKQVIGAGEKR